MTIYEVIKRPDRDRKGVTKKDDERTLCFEVARGRQQDPGEGGGGAAVQGESGGCPHRQSHRQAAAARQVFRLPVGLEKGLRAVEAGQKMPEYAEI